MKKRSLDEYQVLRDLGQGAYGKVFLARDKLTDKIVAIKSVNKHTIIQLDKKRHVYREKTLLSDMQHPFIIKLITTMIVS
jgi:serine/threonine protein kinase